MRLLLLPAVFYHPHEFAIQGLLLAFGNDCVSGCSAPGASLLLCQSFSHGPTNKTSLVLTTDLGDVLFPPSHNVLVSHKHRRMQPPVLRGTEVPLGQPAQALSSRQFKMIVC